MTRHRATARRRSMTLLAAGGSAVSLAVLTASAQARHNEYRGGLPSASAFCARLPASKVSGVVGATVSLFQAVVKNGSLECIYFGTTASHPEVVISMQPGIPASQLATRSKAEARIAAESPEGVKLVFSSLPSIGSTAFSWTYAKPLNGGQLVAIADNKGTTGFGVLIGGAATTFGSAAKHIPVLENLLKLDFAA